MISVKKVNPFSETALILIKELSAEIANRYDFTDDGSGAFKPQDASTEKAIFLVAFYKNEPAGCGALRPLFDSKIAEIKRMYVKPEFRKKGIAGAILKKLEKNASEMGYEKIWLETGDRQPEAIKLYQKSGYTRIPNYGDYKENLHSNCFEKILK